MRSGYLACLALTLVCCHEEAVTGGVDATSHDATTAMGTVDFANPDGAYLSKGASIVLQGGQLDGSPGGIDFRVDDKVVLSFWPDGVVLVHGRRVGSETPATFNAFDEWIRASRVQRPDDRGVQ